MEIMGAKQNGAYDLEGVIWHQHSPRLMEQILKMWSDKERPIIDLGCGLNYYVTVLLCAGYKAWGYDAVMLGHANTSLIDLSKPWPPIGDEILYSKWEGRREIIVSTLLSQEKRNVISLETGEHIPASSSGIFIDNLIKVANGGDIILSWAVPGQAGVGHINCQDNNWVIQEMENRGYAMDLHRSAQLRMAVLECKCDWFKNTLMYFTPEE